MDKTILFPVSCFITSFAVENWVIYSWVIRSAKVFEFIGWLGTLLFSFYVCGDFCQSYKSGNRFAWAMLFIKFSSFMKPLLSLEFTELHGLDWCMQLIYENRNGLMKHEFCVGSTQMFRIFKSCVYYLFWL